MTTAPAPVISPNTPRMRMPLSRREVVPLALLAGAAALFPVVPALLWLTPFIAVAVYVGGKVHDQDSADRKWLAVCALAALLIQGTVILLRQDYDPSAARPTVWLDDQTYFRNASLIASKWREGFFPELSRKGSPPYLGTLHTGYERVLGALFYVTGPSVRIGQLANMLCAALLPVLCFLLSATLFHEGAAPDDGSLRIAEGPCRSVRAPARAAALLCVLYPSLYYWGGMLLKDIMLATLFLAALLLLADMLRRRSLCSGVVFLLVLVWVAIFRNYAALALLSGLFIFAFAHLPRRALAWGLVYGALAIWALSYTDPGARYLEQLLNSLAAQLSPALGSYEGVLNHFGAAVPRMLLAPYAWVRAEGEHPLYALYPGMWYLYLIVYPLALAGLFQAIRHDHRLSILPVGALLASTFVLLAAYGGNAPRQRFYLEIVLMIYAGLGACSPIRRAAFALFYLLLFLFAALQLMRLFLQ